MKILLRLVPAAALCALATGPAWAAGSFVLANSKSHKLQVTAEGQDWCQPLVHLRMQLDPDSPDLANPASQIGVMNLLRTPITAECKTAQAAELTVVEKGAVTGTYRANAADNWSFAAVPGSAQVAEKTPAAPAAAPVAAPPPSADAAKPAPTALPPAAPPSPPMEAAASQGAPAATTAPASAPAPVTAPPPAEPAIPRDINYPAMLQAYLKARPDAIPAETAARWWAAYRYPRDYQQLRQQEFKLRPLLDRAGTELAAAPADGPVTLVLPIRLGSYDFKAHRYPLAQPIETVTVNPPTYESGVPNDFQIALPDLAALLGVPMDEAAAQHFQEQRTSRFGDVDRQVTLVLTVALEPASFAAQFSTVRVKAGLRGLAVFADPKGEQLLHRFPTAELEAMRTELAAAKEAEAAAAASRRAEAERDRLQAQREQAIAMLKQSPPGVKMANWVSNGALDYQLSLDNARGARAEALAAGHVVRERLLVQAKDSGRVKVETRWPGHLRLTLAEGQPDLVAGGWYLVDGMFSVPTEGDEALPPAQVNVTGLYACRQDQCAETGDAAALVDRKIAAAGQPAPARP